MGIEETVAGWPTLGTTTLSAHSKHAYLGRDRDRNRNKGVGTKAIRKACQDGSVKPRVEGSGYGGEQFKHTERCRKDGVEHLVGRDAVGLRAWA